MTEKTEPLPDFEKTLKELETLVEKLERGDLPLDQSLTDFKRGVELTRKCQRVLDEARQSVEMLLDNDDESSTTAFGDDD